jgi:hypothetical protein
MWKWSRFEVKVHVLLLLKVIEMNQFINPLNAELIPSAICWYYYELTLSSMLAG